MAAKKKDFTKADGAIDKFFSPPPEKGTAPAWDGKDAQDTQHTQDTHDTHDTHYAQDAQHTQHTHDAQHTHDTQHTHNTQHTHDAQHTQGPTPTAGRRGQGKRAQRFGLLLDDQLKEDLAHLSKAKGSRSINDMVVGALLEFVGQEENQRKLEGYRKLLKGQ